MTYPWQRLYYDFASVHTSTSDLYRKHALYQEMNVLSTNCMRRINDLYQQINGLSDPCIGMVFALSVNDANTRIN